MRKKADKPTESELRLVKNLVAYWKTHPAALEEFQKAIFLGANTERKAPKREVTLSDHLDFQDQADDWVRRCRRRLPRYTRSEAAELLVFVEETYAPNIIRLLGLEHPGGAMATVIYKHIASAEEEILPLCAVLGFQLPPTRPE